MRPPAAHVLATLVVAAHIAFVAFVVIGGLLVLRWRKLLYLHLAAIGWAVYVEWSGAICPLTPLENHYRDLAGQTTYGEGFVTHYLAPIIYPSGLTRGTQFVILGILAAVNLVGYGLVLARRQRRRDTNKVTFRL